MKTFSPIRCAIGIALILCCCLAPLVCEGKCSWTEVAGSLFGAAALGTSFAGGFGVGDANLKLTLALPNAASTTVNTTSSLDTEATSFADFLARVAVVITAPALNTTVLPDTKTMTYNLIASNNSNLAGAVVVQQAVLQTGAGGAGAALATNRIRLPENISSGYGRYLGLQAVSGANTTNAAGSSATMQMFF